MLSGTSSAEDFDGIEKMARHEAEAVRIRSPFRLSASRYSARRAINDSFLGSSKMVDGPEIPRWLSARIVFRCTTNVLLEL